MMMSKMVILGPKKKRNGPIGSWIKTYALHTKCISNRIIFRIIIYGRIFNNTVTRLIVLKLYF